MDKVTVLQECAVMIEQIKGELCDIFENEKCDMVGNNSEEVNAPVAVLLQPKVEMEELEEQETKPINTVYLFPVEEEQFEDHLAMDPLAGCEEWNEKEPLTDSLLLRVKKEEAAEPEDEGEEDAGIRNERSGQTAFNEVKDDTEDTSGNNRAEYQPDEREASEPQNKDVWRHSLRQPFACKHCSETFRSKKALAEHQQQHRYEPQLLTCDTCQRDFTSRRAILLHFRAHMRKTNFSCETCGKMFKRDDHLKVHLCVDSEEKPHVCNHCGKRFKLVGNLNVHRRMHTGERPYSCSNCNKRFVYKSELVNHTRRHLNIKPYKCKECGKAFLQSGHFAQHLRLHTGERPFKCSVCSKTFVRKEHLNNHMFTHNPEQHQTSKCEVCSDRVRTVYMKIHMLKHTKEKPVKCRFCEAKFAYFACRSKHEEIHSGRAKDRVFQCKECGKSLSSNQSLQSHMRCHSGERPYKCGYCEKTFAQSHSRKSHEARHTKEYPYNCAECGKGYCAKKELVNHIASHGNRKPKVKPKRRVKYS